MIEVKAQIYPTDLLEAVAKMATDFRTGSDSPGVQLWAVEKAQKALHKLQLQISWWARIRELGVSAYAFEFIAEHVDRDNFISKQHACCATEEMAVKELVKAKVITPVSGGWKLNEL